jgi:dephospho-CoA kinase
MKKIAITGNQGSGKSFIIREFSNLGVPTLMMDDVAKSIQNENVELNLKLRNRFPDGYPNGKLDRIKMREILFQDKSGKNLKELEELISLFLWNEIERFYDINKDKPFVIVESALLFEKKMESKFDIIIFVNSDPKIRKERALERDNITSEDYDNRMKNQLPDGIKLEKSDYTIINDFTDNTKDEVYKLFKILENEK